MKLFPNKLKEKLNQKPYLTKITGNMGWLIFDKLFRMGVGLFVSAWITRYLGPVQFGLLSYALALISFLVPFAIFGLNSITVKNLVNHPNQTDQILGSSFLIQFTTTIISFSILFATSFFIEDPLSKSVILIIGLTLFFKPIDTIRYYFEANTQSKYIVWAENVSFIFCSCIKIILILTHSSFLSIVWVFFIDGLITSLLIIIIYSYKNQNIFNWHITWQQIKMDLKHCWPMAFAGLTIMIYMRIDQIMLGHMLGYDAVGIYSAATRISEIWYFIPMVIVSSVNPTLLEIRQVSEENYYKKLRLVMGGLVLISLVIAIIATIFSHFIIELLYGAQYKEASYVLIIHIWTGIFVSLGVVGGQWLITEGLYLQHFYRSLFGAIINIALNFILIPYFSIIGAAIATLIGQISATLLFDFFNKKTKKIFWIKISSFNLLYSLNIFQ